MFWRAFRKTSSQPQTDSWWREADLAADSPTVSVVEHLRRTVLAMADAPDEAERQQEMIEGLEQVQAVVAAPALPLVVTQHRVIGLDICHFVAPVGLLGDVTAPGKLFLTADRVIFATGRVQTWPWHRIRDVVRSGRVLAVVANGGDEVLRVQCNTYGDALVARHLAGRLRQGPPRERSVG